MKLINDKFFAEYTALSKKMQADDDYWEPEWLNSVFTTVLVCNNSDCAESVICSGIRSVDWELKPNEHNEHGEMEQQYCSFYLPKIFIPTIHFFNIPEKCPDSVNSLLIEAFSLTLQSPGSAANKVRAAIENLLTEYGVPRYSRKNGKNNRLTLDSRIAKAKDKNAVLGELMAW
ncbi:hypothetical protein [Acinetobacter sp. DSM 11652]|uniref:hypothetical protein n=1 Tax=Acinetobacter sp. DSM 11652 TaxID=346222 RepID=UPI001D17CA57|nr:hypothetical protein [Acinetobacter sp. DSM 11652]